MNPPDLSRRWFGRLLAGATALPLSACVLRPPPSPSPSSAPSPARFVDLGTLTSRQTASRRVTVWLPPGYDSDAGACDVLYMHDGQNLFDPGRAMAGQPWAVDRHLDALVRSGQVRPTLVVGIDNGPQRWRDYVPAGPVRSLPAELQRDIAGDAGGGLLSDEYLAFLVEELKPRIDDGFRTRPGPAHTHVMGSSMGGLISLYALARHPEVFGSAGCLSTHWPITTNRPLLQAGEPRLQAFFDATLRWFEQHLPAPGRHRLYFDHGDVNLDALYPPLQREVDAMLRRRGWTAGRDWTTLHVPGGDHNEAAWRERLATPLRFLLGRA